MKKTLTKLLFTGSRLTRHLFTVAEDDSLYRRLLSINARGESVTDKLNEFVTQGKCIPKIDLITYIKDRRKFRHFDQALEIMEWMEKRKVYYTCYDYALRLDLVAKAKGVDAAENYFNGIPESAKNNFIYGALLSCYCYELMVDKALDFFKKMDEMKFLCDSFPFNKMMNLHLKLNQPEIALELVQEMKRRKISLDIFSYSMWMQSCVCLNGVEGAESVLNEMKMNDEHKIDWPLYTDLAVHYVKAGLFEKAESALLEAEVIMGLHNRVANHFLFSLYAATSNLNEVNRVWNSLKANFRVTTNGSYRVMIQALGRLKDIDGLTKCYKEWESSCASYDIRIANVTIRAYLENNLQEEAERVLADACKRSSGPVKGREMFMVFYLRNHRFNLALDHLQAALSEVDVNRKWQLREETVRAFIDYFEERDDGAAHFWKILKDINTLDTNAYVHLLKTFIEDDMKLSDKLED